jgi:hypothetical protein
MAWEPETFSWRLWASEARMGPRRVAQRKIKEKKDRKKERKSKKKKKRRKKLFLGRAPKGAQRGPKEKIKKER